jgi:hypothetical protein
LTEGWSVEHVDVDMDDPGSVSVEVMAATPIGDISLVTSTRDSSSLIEEPSLQHHTRPMGAKAPTENCLLLSFSAERDLHTCIHLEKNIPRNDSIDIDRDRPVFEDEENNRPVESQPNGIPAALATIRGFFTFNKGLEKSQKNDNEPDPSDTTESKTQPASYSDSKIRTNRLILLMTTELKSCSGRHRLRTTSKGNA